MTKQIKTLRPEDQSLETTTTIKRKLPQSLFPSILVVLMFLFTLRWFNPASFLPSTLVQTSPSFSHKITGIPTTARIQRMRSGYPKQFSTRANLLKIRSLKSPVSNNCMKGDWKQHSPVAAARTMLRSFSRRPLLAWAEDKPAEASIPEHNLGKLRAILKEKKLDAYIVPTADPHQSEYPPNCFARREFITGFTGSAGTAVITQDSACLWTDGRYFLQAADELSSAWILQKQGLKDTPTISKWLCQSLGPGSRVGIDPFLHTVREVEEFAKSFAENDIELVLESENLIDGIWESRPSVPRTEMRVHPPEWAGLGSPDKLKGIRMNMVDNSADALLVSRLDDVAWLLNVRGGDIESNPVTMAYAIVEPEGLKLFVDKHKVTDIVREKLQEVNAEIFDYAEVTAEIEKLANSGKSIMYDPNSISIALANAAKGSHHIIERNLPIDLEKAIKNDNELNGMIEAHLRDGAALAKWWAYLEAVTKNGESIDEYVAGAELENFRAEQSGFIESSFPAIVGEGPNGAVIHYRASKKSARQIKAGSLLLVDSGGQYDCGTTDVTRVFHLGGDDHQPTKFMREVFTRVLKGHIALDTSVWPEGTPGFVLDAYARRPLWEAGLNYLHGTGHGVGAALNVHEGPQSISPRFNNETPLKPGMIVSNEPAYYEDGSFGVRIENLLYVEKAATSNQFNGVQYLKFSKLTHCPIQAKMLEKSLLTDFEIEWINQYHRQVWDKISPRLSDEPVAIDWLFENTQPIKREGDKDNYRSVFSMSMEHQAEVAAASK
mmetsp:Transcript_3447/g.8118  ORF Transcript_3447/g.8118 Transcript_3447/m.8118 type:complete len:777 (-) Transcript_3447:379-2709(-)